jgi:hypothetical protein
VSSILRSYYQTCLYAQINPNIAILDVLLTPKDVIESSPQNFTPYAIQKRLEDDKERFNLLNKVLTEQKLSSLAQYNIDLSKLNR